ncbi:hypothetical protein Spb1_10320 [Planctopirus ephydatiae]|uniref:DinB superfamily protein n=1 Tax=Planctopirus ephydatiae TaxID=2528019 RepID=A0A518GKJ8_9PLAN|nr:DUF1569 domain-containing protein [Planctopirus ephydatiae]QDV29163.1 hypothetical protein Spb1_10320 [Planctopirus ephydatiae]
MLASNIRRRSLRFENLQQALEDAEIIFRAPGGYFVTGRWSAGQILDHLAFWVERPVDGFPFQLPWLMRWFGPLMKRTMLEQPMRPGFQWRGQIALLATPQLEIEAETGLAHFRRAIERFEAGPLLPRSPAFGPMSRKDWTKLQCRHAELHLSFLHPQSSP